MKKRWLAILLTCCMVLTLLPLTASAATVRVTVTTMAELQAAIANANPANDTRIIVNAQSLTLATGDDITLDGTGKNITVVKGRHGYLFQVPSGATLTLRNVVLDGDDDGRLDLKPSPDGSSSVPDNMGSGGSLISLAGTLNMYDGAVLQNNYSGFRYPATGEGAYNSGAVYINREATFNMYGGTIRNNRVSRGGIRYAPGAITSSAAGGGAVCVDRNATFNMYGGLITNNKAGVGGAVMVYGTFNMTGGVITNNYTKTIGGAAVTVFQPDNGNARIMIGGTSVIENNYISYASGSDLDPVDTTDVIGNLAARDNAYLVLGTGANAPAAGMRVGVDKVYNDGVFVQSGASATHVQYFTADDEDKDIFHAGGQLIVSDTPPTNTAPVFTEQPTSQSVPAGQSVTFTAGAQAFPAATYYWQQSIPLGNGLYGPWTNATNMLVSRDSLTIPNVTIGMDGYIYRCVAVNSEGTAYSAIARLSVPLAGAPVFTLQPKNQYAFLDESATFTAAATGASQPTYQWQGIGMIDGRLQLNWIDIPGAAGSTLTVSNFSRHMDGNRYRCVATNAISSTISDVAILRYGADIGATFISASELPSFGTIQMPYKQPSVQLVTITNTGTMPVTLTQPTASSNYEIGPLSTTQLDTYGAIATFSVRPKANLPAGIYNETIVIIGSNGAGTAVDVSFTVTAGTNKPGDINLDGDVNVRDLSILLENYGLSGTALSNPNADINNDGDVNVRDLSILLENYGK